MAVQELYADKLGTRLVELDGHLERLKARSDLVLLRVEEQHYQAIKNLRTLEQTVRTMLDELHQPGCRTRNELKQKIEQAEDELQKAMTYAAMELNVRLEP